MPKRTKYSTANSHWSCVNFERRLQQGSVLYRLGVVIAQQSYMYSPSWLLLRFWQSYNLKQFGCFCTEKRCKHAQIYPVIPHVQRSSRLKYIVKHSDVDRMKFCHICKHEHCSLFILLLKTQQALLLFESISVRRQSNSVFCVSITVLKIFLYICGRTRTVANPHKSVQCMCCGFLVVRNIHHARTK